MNIEELQALNPETKIKEAIELSPEATYLIVLEDKLPVQGILRIKEIFAGFGIKAIIYDRPLNVYRLQQKPVDPPDSWAEKWEDGVTGGQR